MDEHSFYRPGPGRVVFQLKIGETRATARVALDALAHHAGCTVQEDNAVLVYRTHWRVIHDAAAKQIELGNEEPFLLKGDLQEPD